MATLVLRQVGFLVGIPAILAAVIGLPGCGNHQSHFEPAIAFTKVPPADSRTPSLLGVIEGRVVGAGSRDRLVLYSRSGTWWVQPPADHPFAPIGADHTWKGLIRPGIVYAALLVDSQYHPPATLETLPEKGGLVRAVASVRGTLAQPPPSIEFSGYQWEIRHGPNGSPVGNVFDPANVWIDKHGFLHLRISKQPNGWANSGIKLSHSLGYGSYRLVVENIEQLEPAAIFAVFTWDDTGPSREMDIEVSRWGQPDDKNAQFVVQPWDVPANTVRFLAPAGLLTSWMKWERGRVAFRMSRGSGQESPVVADHVFTSGVPSAGEERLCINLYVYDHSLRPFHSESEVIIESFEYLP
jgi:hypothetical protein